MESSLKKRGVFLLVLQGVNLNGIILMGRALKEREMPYYRLMAVAHIVAAVGIAICILYARLEPLKKRQWTWVVMRGAFGAGAFVASIISVRLGVNAGDVAALSSINTVFASLLGRAFLNEAFGWIHVVSLCFTLSGAVLVAKPSFLFGDSSGIEIPWLGYILALGSGVFYAGGFISSRKAIGVSVWHLTGSVLWISAIAFVLLPVTLVDDFTLDPLLASPGMAVGLLGLTIFVSILGWVLLCAGAKWCPAAVSATTMTGSRMVSGYAAQAIFFGSTPDSITMLGAALMLGGVVAVTLARGTASAAVESTQVQLPSATEHDFPEESIDSLSRFIAAEYVDVSGRHHENEVSTESGLRMRRDSDNVQAQSIGAPANDLSVVAAEVACESRGIPFSVAI